MSKQDIISSPYSKMICPICNKDNNNNTNSLITDTESGEIICSNCGLVVSDKIEEIKPEWRVFNAEESNNRLRTGAPTSLARHDMGLSTIIGKYDKDAAGSRIDTSIKFIIDRLRMLDYRIQLYGSTDRSLKRAFTELDTLKDKLALPNSVVEKAAYLYRKAQERGLIRGRTMSAMIAATIYIACRQILAGKTLNEIAEGSNVKPKILSQSYRILVTELDIKTAPMLDPMKCIAKVANKLKLNERTTRQAMNIMNEIITKEKSAGKHPMGLAAAALYMSCLNNTFPDSSKKDNRNNNTRTQASIAQAAGITDVTLRNTVKKLKNELLLLN
jgi:transcription initiation factor TFIIB